MQKLAGTLVEYTLHPGLILGAVLLWYQLGSTGSATLIALMAALAVIRVCETFYPAHADWQQTSAEVATILAVTLVGLILLGVVDELYAATLAIPLATIREAAGITIWPDAWPMLAQILLLYFASEFIFYWIHRGIHNSTVLWRLSGHGFHHSFKNLHAINFLTAHPFKIFFLSVPTLLLSYLVGAPSESILGAALLLTVNACFAHANVRIKSDWLGLFFTNSVQHSRHHSTVFAESNTNFSCNAIIWDRLFGTFSKGAVEQTGIGPTEPDLLAKLLLPVREPDDIQTAPRQAT